MTIESTGNIGEVALQVSHRDSDAADAVERDIESEVTVLLRHGLSPTERDAWRYVLRDEHFSADRLLQIASCLKRNGIRPEDSKDVCDDFKTILLRKFPGFPEDERSLEALAVDLQAVKNYMSVHFPDNDLSRPNRN